MLEETRRIGCVFLYVLLVQFGKEEIGGDLKMKRSILSLVSIDESKTCTIGTREHCTDLIDLLASMRL